MATVKFLVLTSLLLSLIAFGCSVPPDALQTLPTITLPLDATPITAKTPALSSKPQLEATPTVTTEPDTSPPTSTPLVPTSFPTRMFVPTLSPEAFKKNLIKLFSTNGGCDFPCWWGVRPSDPMQAAFSLSMTLGEAPHIHKNYSYYSLSLGDFQFRDLSVEFFSDLNGAIQDMTISLTYPSRLSDYIDAFERQLALHSLLERYGKPNEVQLLIKPRSEPNSHIAYDLMLIYDTRGFGVEYWGIVDDEDPIRICSIKMNDHHLYEVRLYTQDLLPVLEERSQFFLSEFRPLDEVTSMSPDDFYQVYSDANYSGCIETSYELWK